MEGRIQNRQAELITQRLIATEINLSRLPFFATSTKGLKKKTKIEYRHQTEIEGEVVDVLWKVTANAEYGYPGPFADAVHTALLDIITERGLPIRNPITFTLYDVCRRLDINTSGKSFQNIRHALTNWPRSPSSSITWNT